LFTGYKIYFLVNKNCISAMWTIPHLEDIEATLRDPDALIGKRMRAAYYAKQLFMNDKTKVQQERKTQDDDNNDTLAVSTFLQRRILDVLCQQVFVKEHGSLLRHEFAYVLGQMQSTRACPALERLLQTPNDCVMVRHEAAEALGAIASKQSIPALQQTREDNQGICDELADTCLLALNRIVQEESVTTNNQGQKSTKNNTTMVVGCACMMAPYNSVDPAVSDPKHDHVSTVQLGEILLDATSPLLDRYQAMFSLRNRGGREAVLQLCRTLVEDTSSPLLRHEVAFVLGQLQHASSIDALETSLSRLDEHTMVRHESAEALGAIEGTDQDWQRIESILLKYQQDPDPAVAESCIVALDAADYFGAATVRRAEKEEVDTNVDSADPKLPTSFGQQKHHHGNLQTNEMRRHVLAEHFNVATTTTSSS
jgi:deoxyhypusine monooxygenase